MSRDSHITIREARVADAAGIARVHVDTWRSTYAGIVPASYLTALSYDQKAKKHAEWLVKPIPGTKTFVADGEGGASIVAFAEGGRERGGHPVYKGELNAIYVSDKYQRCGIGQQLVREVVKHLRALGLANMVTWALEDNPYARFYEKIGGTRVGEKWLDMDGKRLKEIAFGWHDLPIL
jgi:ribosomal protein S18 acetylase RimI-like enzyme